MRFYVVGIVTVLLIVLGVVFPGHRETGGIQVSAAMAPHWKMMDRYCTTCHDQAEKAGGLALTTLNIDQVEPDAPIWEKVVQKVRGGMMPPSGEPRPSRKDLDKFASAIEGELDTAAAKSPNPGTPTLHRLNRTEYANVIRDLLALNVDVSTMLPADDTAEGFDNIADVLGVSPALIQGYVSAAMKLSRLAVGDTSMAPTRVTYRAPAGLRQTEHIEGLPLGTRGGMLVRHFFPLDAEYEFKIAGGRFGLFAPRSKSYRIDVTLDGQAVDVKNTRDFTLKVGAGPHSLGVAIVDDERSAGVDDIYSVYSIAGSVQNVVIIGPNNPTGPGDTPSRHKIFTCYPKDKAAEEPCARKIIASLATRAFRRPVTGSDVEMTTLMKFYAAGRKGGSFDTGIQQALARILVDPQFLYRFEQEPDNVPPGGIYRITDLDLASRLSFFLWSSIPDDQLREIAAKGMLHDPKVLEAQVRRMLKDPRAHALVTNFAGQWLELRLLASAQPDVPEFDENLREAMKTETEMMVSDIMTNDRSIIDLLDSDYTFVNNRLARHYGIPNIKGSYFRKISLAKDSPRRGVLGEGSILTLTSVANRTSPVERGKWVLDNVLGVPPPSPPPGVVVNLDKQPDPNKPMTLRERLERHRTDPVCASCHKIMDPIGFSMENFDQAGKWRTMDTGSPIDASGKLVDGTPLDGVSALRNALLSRPVTFATTATRKLMTYALGRGLQYYDMPAVRKIVHDAEKNDYRFSAFVLGVAESMPFQMKMKKPADGKTGSPL